MRIDSAILSNAIITASSDNPIVSGSSQVDITNTTGYSTFSSSIKTYADAKVAGLVDSAPGTLDTLNELAAALGDDANLSASIATSIGNRLLTSVHNTYSASADAHLDANISSLSGSAHTRRNQQISALSASAHTRREEISASLDATIDALDTLGISTDTERGALSSSAHTQRVALNSAQTTANNNLSSSIATALRAEITSGDAAFLTSASIGATINDNAVKLSGIESGATADQSDSEIKTAYENNSDTNAFTDALLSKLNAIEASADVTDATNVAAAGALMSSSLGEQINDDSVKLSGIEAGATADQSNAEIRAAVEAATDSNVFTDADHSKLNGIEASADVTDTANVVAALTAGTNVTIANDGTISSTDTNTTYTVGDGGLTQNNFTNALKSKLDGIEASADVTDTANVTSAGAVMDSELTNESAVKAINQGLTTTSDVTFADLLVTGDLTVQGSRTELQVTSLNVEDLNITVASGSANSSAADGAGLTIAGANESLTWDHGNSRFNFSDDLHVVGNITVSGNVDGRDVASDGSKLDGIESGADVTDTTNVVAALTAGTNISIAGDGTISATDTDTNTFRTVVAGGNTLGGSETLTLSAGSNVSISESGGTVTISSTDTDTNTQLSTEQVQDIVGAMFSGNTETRISATYQDGDGTIDLVVDDMNQSVGNGTLTVEGTGALGGSGTFTANQSGNTTISISHDDTSSQSSVNNSGRTYIQDITLDGYGHVTGISSATETVVNTDTNTTYSAGTGLDLSGTTFSIETDLRDGISYIGYDSGDYVQWSNNTYFRSVVNGTERLRVDTSGIDVSGRIVADSDITAYSDASLKKDVKTIENALDKTKELRGVEFTRIADDTKSIGVIAQELEKVLPELVLTDDEGIKSVNYAQITGLLIEAVKELSAKVEELSK